MGAWVLGVLALLLWRLAGWTVVRRLTHRSVLPVPAELQTRLAELAGRRRVTRPVRLLISGIAVVPSVIGWFRPVILLPVAAVAGLTPEQLETILAHELAHVRRHDYLVNTFQGVIEIGPPTVIKGYGKPVNRDVGGTKTEPEKPVVGNK